eukprot:SAG11_NODE_1759_length_4305_cov_3.542558_3_plen_101_part_00
MVTRQLAAAGPVAKRMGQLGAASDGGGPMRRPLVPAPPAARRRRALSAVAARLPAAQPPRWTSNWARCSRTRRSSRPSRRCVVRDSNIPCQLADGCPYQS